MNQDLFVPEEWERLNDNFRARLKVPVEQSVKIYRGLGHAIYECAYGTSQFLSHKRSVGFIKGNTPYFDFLIPNYLREAYQIQSMDSASLKQHHASWTDWVNTLKKDTVFVIACEDHPITGELQDLDELDRVLNEKKVFFLRVSHSLHHFRPLELLPYTVRICSLQNDWALAFMGSKFKTPPVLAQVMNWSVKDADEVLQSYQKKSESQKIIENIEAENKEFSFPWTGASRLYDRSLLVCPGVTGDLMTQTLTKALGLKAEDSSFLSSTHLCSWDSMKMFKTWWKEAPSEEKLRDLLILTPEICQKSGISSLIKKTYEELKSSQSWNF